MAEGRDNAVNPPPNPSAPQGGETVIDIEADLQIEKLRLEVESLRHKLFHRNDWMEWMKAASGPVAVLGLVISTILAALQMGAAREAGLEDRFQREVAHLGSSSTSERLTGVAGLSLILGDGLQAKRHREAVSFLVNELSVEQDTTVRGAMVDAIAQLDPKKPSQSALAEEALQLLIARNRGLNRMHEFSAEELLPQGAEKSQQLGPLLDTGNLIARLIREGASSGDLSGIACIGCDFSGSKHQRPADFGGSVLANADFSKAYLEGANFLDSVLLRTKFVGADLQDANLGEDLMVLRRKLIGQSAQLLSQSSHSLNPPSAPPGEIFPDFRCANLQGAHFDGRTLLGVYLGGNWEVESADFSGANVDGTDLTSFAILYADERAKNIVDFSSSVPFSGFRFATLYRSALTLDGKTEFPFSIITTDSQWYVGDLHSSTISSLGYLADRLHSSKNVDRAKLAPRFREYLSIEASGTTTSPVDCSPVAAPQ